jgi:divalent metal cation (Fe/Co/Zn/Cd) transporter
MREARRPPSQEHPMGYGTVVYFWAFLVSVLLFTVGGVFSIYEGAHKLSHPEPMAWPGIAIAVLAVAVILEAFSLTGCIREIRKVARGRSLWRFFRESRNTELIVVLGEDIAALLGLAFALAAVLLAIATANPVFDAYGSIAVGVLLIVVAVLLAIEIKALITGQSAEPAVEAGIRAFLAGRSEVAEVLSLLTLQMGEGVMVAVKARMDAPDATALVDAINRVEADLRTAFPEVRWMFFEPDHVS